MRHQALAAAEAAGQPAPGQEAEQEAQLQQESSAQRAAAPTEREFQELVVLRQVEREDRHQAPASRVAEEAVAC